jgi:hypothetical protein
MPPEDCIKREEYQQSMARLHERLDGIATNTTKIEVAAEYISKSVDRMHEAIFGNGKPGALQRITQVWTKISIQWWLIGGLMACIGVMATIFIGHLGK